MTELLTSQAVLGDIAKNDMSARVRMYAVEKLTDEPVLAHVAKTHSDVSIRLAAVEKLTDLTVLAEDREDRQRLDGPRGRGEDAVGYRPC